MDNEELVRQMQAVSDELYLNMRDRLIDWLVTTYNESVPEMSLLSFSTTVEDALGAIAAIEFLERVTQ